LARIVVVDDELAIRELFAYWLDDAGHCVLAAASASEAQDVLRAEPADVLLTDISMADASGIDLLNWSRQHDPDMPVVLVTGKPGVDTAVDALRLGAYDYLVKPVSDVDLLRVVDRAVTHRRLLRERQQLEEKNRRYQEQLEEQVALRTATLRRRNRQLLLLQKVTDQINALEDVESLYRRLVGTVHGTFGYADVSIFAVDWDSDSAKLVAAAGDHQHTWPPGFRQPIDEGLVGKAVRESAYVLANDVSVSDQYVEVADRGVKSEAAFPIRRDSQVSAVLLVSETQPNAFDDTDVMVLRTLTEHLGVVVSNAELYAKLQRALHAREAMLANVSHELRSPLSVIVAWAEMLSEEALGPVSEEVKRAAANILDSAEHLTHLVNLLLTFQRLDRDELPMEPVGVRKWLEDTVSAWRPVFDRAGLTLALDVERGVGLVMGNEAYLQQVLNNLLDNVRKFTPPGGEAVVSARRAGDDVVISVRDDGIGVHPDKLGDLFERFYQVDSGEARRYGGMGIGLSVSKEIVSRHGGRIWAESAGEGEGLAVLLALPTADIESGERAVSR